jgi:2-phospho-L-lactate guanylyltransferase
MATTAIVPLKALGAAKGRLAGQLDPDDRRELVAWMFERVVSACRECPEIDEVLVVAGDDEGARLTQSHPGVRAIVEPRPGLQAALRVAEDAAAGATTTLVVAADLPHVTAADLSAVIHAANGQRRAVVVVRTSDGGSGALLRRPPRVISTAFGPGSAGLHASMARAAGVRPVILRRGGLTVDVDTPEQLAALRGPGVPSRRPE